MHNKMEIYAEILRQLGRIPDDYREPEIEEMGEMEDPEGEEYKSPKAEAVRTKGEKKER